MTECSLCPRIAIDGGGTRCRLAFASGAAWTRIETGAANVSTDFLGAVAEIERGLQDLRAQTGLTGERLAETPAFVGLAGMVSEEISDALRKVLPFKHMRIEDDRPAALRGALGPLDGVLIHCGTGSFFGAQAGGRMRFVGGWGPILGDEASAHSVGKAALSGVLHSVDGHRPSSPLSKTLLARFGGAVGIVHFASSAAPSELAAVAEDVTTAAETRDTLATDILQRGADHIAARVRDLGWRSDQRLCLTGGIGPHYAPFLPQDLRAALVVPAGDPLDGGLSLALDMATST